MLEQFIKSQMGGGGEIMAIMVSPGRNPHVWDLNAAARTIAGNTVVLGIRVYPSPRKPWLSNPE